VINTKVLSGCDDVEMAAIYSLFELAYDLTDLRVSSCQIVYFFPRRGIYKARKYSHQKTQCLSSASRALYQRILIARY
jgi:hypothetical protein